MEVTKQAPTEAEAIRCAQEGDASAFEYLYNAHSKRVYSICLRMLRDRSDAEDLTQQVFLRVFQKLSTFRGDSCFSTWLHRVTVNAVLMHLRRKKPTEIQPGDAFPVPTKSEDPHALAVDNTLPDTAERLNLTRAIHKLPAGYKRLFLLHDVLGYQHGEIAELVGCSVGCSKSQVHKARRRLRSLLSSPPRQEEAERHLPQSAISPSPELDRNTTKVSQELAPQRV